MTIRIELFTGEIQILAEWFNKPLTPIIMERLLRGLEEKLTEAEFVAACKRAFESDRYFPNVDRFVELAHGSREAAANEDWLILDKASRRGRDDAKSLMDEYLSDSGRRALREIGGLSRLSDSKESDLQWIKKDFVTCWVRNQVVPQRQLNPVQENLP